MTSDSSTSEYPYSTLDLAAEVNYTRKTARKRAKALGLGLDLGGSRGYVYSEADRRKFLDSLRPVNVPTRQRKKKAAA